ncbi:MAG: outer membrane protein assembly factor BamA [Tannerella sp.]|jgi:outer membrane protein insertion porin family|nr:outer membrane protein assembly factor BamA [Tannerella sp.]
MDKKLLLLYIFFSFSFWGISQEGNTVVIPASPSGLQDSVPVIIQPDSIRKDTFPASEIPEINYSLSSTRKYKIQDIDVTGADNYEDFVLIGYSGLAVGDEISVPGTEITDAVSNFWRNGLFSNVKILASRMVDDKVWLEIRLTPRPRISQITYNGVKKGERTDLENKLNLRKGHQITPHITDRAKILINKYFEEKGFKNITVDIVEKPDPQKAGEVIVDVNIDKNEKTKIQKIYFEGNEQLTDFQLRKAMKKTNERFNLKERFRNSWLELFSTKKFTPTEYSNDKKNLIDKYYEYGYSDATITADSVVEFDKKRVNIYLNIEEGQQYFIKDISFVGNTKYSSDDLARVLNMKGGDVYNQKKLIDRMMGDDDAMMNLYMNNGYMFARADPVEVEIKSDSVTLEIRILEGPQATINKVIINGNDRLYEDIVRRELRTKPGDLFSREELIRSVRELAQMGHFDPENMNPDFNTNEENGTVDVIFNLTSKANDQVEFSLGWGQTGIIGKLGLKFSNFSLSNLLNPDMRKGIIPQGEGQSLNLSGQTNGSYFQSYSISFLDPWFGGKRPNTLSVSAYFTRYTSINSRYMQEMQSNMYNYYDPYSMYGYGYPYSSYGGYGGGYGGYGYNYEDAYDKSKYMQILGVSIGYGKRLKWPDDYFQFMATLSYQMYMLKNFGSTYYLGISEDGHYNDINLELLLQRNSIDNPLYTRYGSTFSLSAAVTPPYSLFDGKDYAAITSEAVKFKWLEYYKIKFKSKMFIPLLPLSAGDRGGPKRTPVLMSRVEVGWIGAYNQNKQSPFGTFYIGGDGMTGGYQYSQETVALRGYANGSIAGNTITYARAYSRLSLELRYPLILEPSSTIYGLAFVEAGDGWSSMKDFNPFNLKRSAGAGVRIFLPMIGLMGIDWGYGFDKISTGERGGSQFHFILGQEF